MQAHTFHLFSPGRAFRVSAPVDRQGRTDPRMVLANTRLFAFILSEVEAWAVAVVKAIATHVGVSSDTLVVVVRSDLETASDRQWQQEGKHQCRETCRVL